MLKATLSICITVLLVSTFGYSQDDQLALKQNSGIQISTKFGSNGIQIIAKTPFKKKSTISVFSGVYIYQFRRPININLEEESKLQIRPNFLSYGVTVGLEKRIKSWIKLTAGINANVQQKWELNLSTDRPINLNGLSLTAEDFGQIDAKLKWLPIQPYLEIGLGKNNNTKQWNVCTNIGTRYMGSPKLWMKYEGFLETTTLNQSIPRIEKNMKNYSFYPSINVELSYKIAFKRP